jgi:hypothetical protein
MNIISTAQSLKSGGRIVIVTDNRAYARLLAATVARVIQQNKKLLRSVQHHELKSSHLQLMESFAGNVCLYQGRPSHDIGHANDKDGENKNGSSYFDRLWRTGAGRHSERNLRFVLIMQRLAT